MESSILVTTSFDRLGLHALYFLHLRRRVGHLGVGRQQKAAIATDPKDPILNAGRLLVAVCFIDVHGGRYVRVRENTWLDPVLESGYQYPDGRWYTSNAWGRRRIDKNIENDEALTVYLKSMWRWIDAIQNDFAARSDWCVKPFDQANHPPVVTLGHAANLEVKPDTKIELSARGTSDPDGDKLEYRWWQHREAGSYDGKIDIRNASKQDASFSVPGDVGKGETIHIICEVTDAGTPPLTRYQRMVVTIK